MKLNDVHNLLQNFQTIFSGFIDFIDGNYNALEVFGHRNKHRNGFHLKDHNAGHCRKNSQTNYVLKHSGTAVANRSFPIKWIPVHMPRSRQFLMMEKYSPEYLASAKDLPLRYG